LVIRVNPCLRRRAAGRRAISGLLSLVAANGCIKLLKMRIPDQG